MLRIRAINQFAVVCAFTILSSSFCMAEKSGDGGLVSVELLEHAKLKIVWENELPIKKSEVLDSLHLGGDYLYTFSDRNYIVCLNRNDGSFMFGRSYAPAGFPILGFELYEDKLLSVIGNSLVEIRNTAGTELSSVRLDFGVSCPAVRNSSSFYIAGVDRRVHVLTVEDKVERFKVAADNDSVISSVVAGEQFMIFGTEAGNVIAVKADEPKRLWQFDARSGIMGSLLLDDGSVFVSSKDTNVYMIDAATGGLVWKYQTESMLDKTPTVTKNAVYQYVWGKGLTAIDRASGKCMWKIPGGLELLAEADGKTYVITENETLIVMDNEKRKQLYSVNFAGVSLSVANTTDSKIYIADKAGRIACLEPLK